MIANVAIGKCRAHNMQRVCGIYTTKTGYIKGV